MSKSVGTTPVINTHSPPTLITLSTKNTTSKDSSLSDVTWGMVEAMQVPSPHYAAQISVHSMSFFNTFRNIEAPNNKLIILNTWTNNDTPEERLTTIEVPSGIYTVATLLDSLNTQMTELDTYLYGFGNVVLNGGAIPLTPPLTQSADGSKTVINAPSIAAMDFTGDATHQYTGAYLVINSQTEDFMKTLGFINYDFNGAYPLQRKLVTGVTTNLEGIGFQLGYSGVYSFFNPAQSSILSPDVIDISGTNSLSINLQATSSNARNSYNNLTNSDTIGLVPVVGSTGFKTIYHPPIPFQATVTNFQTNEFHIIIIDAATGRKVDFQGADWTITLIVQYTEIDNVTKSESSAQGNYDMHHPALFGAHSELRNMDPHSMHAPGLQGSLHNHMVSQVAQNANMPPPQQRATHQQRNDNHYNDMGHLKKRKK